MADELGSGMRKLMKYAKYYGGSNPKFFEGDVFRIVVTVPEFRDIVSERRAYAPDTYPNAYLPNQRATPTSHDYSYTCKVNHHNFSS